MSFPEKAETKQCVTKLRALADEVRLGVLERLLDGPKHVWELVASLHVEQSLMSHHLQVLRKEGLVEAKREGKSVLYQLTRKPRRNRKAIDLGCCSLSF